MASHGRGRGVRRNFETGKETKVSFCSQKSRLKTGKYHLFGLRLRDCFSSLPSRLELVGKKEKRRVDVAEKERGRQVEVFWQTPEVPWQTHPFRRGLPSLISWTLLRGWR